MHARIHTRTSRQYVRSGATAALVVLCIAMPAAAQITYSFTSGPSGDGFTWPASPTGLLDGDYFITPEGVEFDNYTENTVFFDTQYQVVGNAAGISADALWGNPLDLGGLGSVEVYLYDPNASHQTVGFNIAWSVAGSPGATPDSVEIYVEDSEGRATDTFPALVNTFTGFGGFDGYTDRIELDASNFVDDYFNVDGGPFVDISYIAIFVGDIATPGGTSEFGIDNFDIDGGTGGTGDLFPSVNGGTVDITGSTLTHNVLRGTGTHGVGIGVTNAAGSSTTYSTLLVPGGGLTDAGQVSNAPILGGQTIQIPTLVTVDRSWATGTYHSDLLLVNDNNPSDPNDPFGLQAKLLEPPVLTAPSPVDVSAAEKVQLSNASDPPGGFRASVKVTGTSVTGPFAVSGFAVDTPVRPDETIEGDPTFDRFGQLSGAHNGTMTASLQMTAYTGASNDIAVFLVAAEPVADEQWTLNATLADILFDSLAYASAEPLGPGLVGVNSATTAGTLVGGTTTASGSVALALGNLQDCTSTGIIGDGLVVSFSGAVPVHAVQMTYRDADLCPAIIESNLRLLYLDSGAADWDLAANGNSDGGAGATFFAGSFDAFVATLGGAPLSSALGTHGVDTVNDHVWAILDHDANFGTGEIGQTCRTIGDSDNDGDVDMTDFNAFNGCMAGPDNGLGLDCDCFDVDAGGDVTIADFAEFQVNFSGN